MNGHNDVIAVAALRLDSQNPRLSAANEGSREVLRAMWRGSAAAKLLALAADIVRYGLNPAEKFIVIPDRSRGVGREQYIVIEGNRRLSALKALETPDQLDDVLDAPSLRRLRVLAESYAKVPIEDVDCVVFEGRDDVDHWLTIRHDGQNQGAGLVGWGAMEKARYQARQGKKRSDTRAARPPS